MYILSSRNLANKEKVRPTLCEYLERRFGSRWVVAKRTTRMLEKYGSDTIFISHKRYLSTINNYRYDWGDPYDPVRAELYLCLCQVLIEVESLSDSLCCRIRAALDADSNPVAP